jgi:hypothetical protein
LKSKSKEEKQDYNIVVSNKNEQNMFFFNAYLLLFCFLFKIISKEIFEKLI